MAINDAETDFHSSPQGAWNASMIKYAAVALFFTALLFFAFAPFSAHAGEKALSFDGVDDHVNVGTGASLDLGSNFEVSFWLKTDAGSFPNIPILLGRIDAGGAYTRFWYIGINTSGRIEASLGDGANYSQIFSNAAINDGNWHHVAWTRSGDSQTITIDDTDQTDINYIDPDIGDVNPPTNTIFGGDVESDNYYYGDSLDEITITVLGSVRGKWTFEEGLGTLAADSSGNGNDGAISGASWIEAVVPPPAPSIISVGGAPAHRPEVIVNTPRRLGSYSDTVAIDYKATDGNDLGGAEEKQWLGMGDEPVAIYYSPTGDIRRRNLIAKDLPPFGTYEWNTANVPSGDRYHLIVEATDNINETGSVVIGPITIDHEDPVFDIALEPRFTKGEDIAITAVSSKKLSAPPEVLVTQQGFQPTSVAMKSAPDGKTFTGRYQVLSGYDGTAEISITGKDELGNVGTTLIGDKTFSVNLLPPPAPVVTAPLDGELFETASIDVEGRARSDLSAILSVNDADTHTAKTDTHGNFTFKDIPLDKESTNGRNVLRIASVDTAGTVSESVNITVVSNHEPELSIIAPRRGDSLSGTEAIRLAARDQNGDVLAYDMEISRDNGATWQALVLGEEEETYEWDTTEVPDGGYLIRAAASDGALRTQTPPVPFSVDNFLARVIFPEAEIFTATSRALIQGTAEGRARRGSRTITGVEYSRDNGATWASARAHDRAFDGFIEDFIFELDRLEEGRHEILVRGIDERGLFGTASVYAVADFTAPSPPRILAPAEEETVGFPNESAPEQAGIQAKVAGTAEPFAHVALSVGLETVRATTDEKGAFEVSVTLGRHGENRISAVAADRAGNRSAEAHFSVTRNNPPELSFIWPRKGGGLNHDAEIAFQIKDQDLDEITESALSYQRAGENRKNVLARNMSEDTFRWDVSDFAEGRYALFLEASDGVSRSTITREFFIDNTNPNVGFTPLTKETFTEQVTLEVRGAAADDLSGLEYIEYAINPSLDRTGEKANWYKALITGGYKTNEAAFRATHPHDLADGTYEVSFRATDAAGNVSPTSEVQKITIDTHPPRIGSFMLEAAPLVLFPGDGAFTVIEDTEISFSISLERDTVDAALLVGENKTELSPDGALWSSELSFGASGTFPLAVSAEDDFGNITGKKEIGTVRVVPRGSVREASGEPIAGALLAVQTFLEDEQRWTRWQAESYGFDNPASTNDLGEYGLLLPAGKYQITITKDGFRRVKSPPFILNSPEFIFTGFSAEPRKGLKGWFEDILERISFR